MSHNRTAGDQSSAGAAKIAPSPYLRGCYCGQPGSCASDAATRPHAPFPPPPSTEWATPSVAAGEREFAAVQRGACYCGWANDYRDCAACRYCRAGPRPAGYPYTPFHMGTSVASAAIAPPAQAELAYPQSQTLSGAPANADGTVGVLNAGQSAACKAFGGECRTGPSDWLAPAGARSVKIAEPDVWTVLPNQVPPAVAINAYYNDLYINDIYDNRRGRLFPGCTPGRAGRCASCTK